MAAAHGKAGAGPPSRPSRSGARSWVRGRGLKRREASEEKNEGARNPGLKNPSSAVAGPPSSGLESLCLWRPSGPAHS